MTVLPRRCRSFQGLPGTMLLLGCFLVALGAEPARSAPQSGSGRFQVEAGAPSRDEGIPDSRPPAPLFSVRAEVSPVALSGQATLVRLRLMEESGRFPVETDGIRATLTLDPPAFFTGGALKGRLLSGVGSDRALVEFEQGLAEIALTSNSAGDVKLGLEDTERLGIWLRPEVSEDFESGRQGFDGDGRLLIAGAAAQGTGAPVHSGRGAWLLSSGSGADSYALSPVLDLAPGAGPRAVFWSRLDLGSGAAARVEISTGEDWTELSRLPETSGAFRQESFDLSDWSGTPVRLRFHLTGQGIDGSYWVIDDFLLAGQSPRVRFLDAGSDPDVDGLLSLDEIRAGTNPLFADSDADGVVDGQDNCPRRTNPDQVDLVHPGRGGDACEDPDADGIADLQDNCPDRGNPEQIDVCSVHRVAPALTGSLALPFAATDLVFDPARPYLYASDIAARKVYFINLGTGLIEKEFSFTLMPESVALTPDGSRLFVALLTRPHDCCWWDGTHEGYIASFDLAAQVKDREFRIAEDPFDLVATTSGHLVVTSGSGQWTYIRVFDAVTGQETGAAYGARHRSRLTLHPTERIAYAADTDSYPSDIERYDLTATGAITARWDSPYHGDHRMDGNVWASPLGDMLVTRGGDAFTVGSSRTTDMIFLQGLSAGAITDLAWDAGHSAIFTAEGSSLRYYNLQSRFEIGATPLSGMADFVGLSGGSVYAALVESSSTTVIGLPHPVPGGGANTAPTASFAVSPQMGRTTQTDLLFDASASSDAQDPLSSLRFRWDFNNDGVWDTGFLDDPAYLKRFNTAGTKIVRLQVRDSLALVSEIQQSLDVTFEPDPGTTGPAHPPFDLPFEATDLVFDPARPYLYASDSAARKVYFISLSTGLIEKEFSFTLIPESLALAPDGSRLFAALLTRPHDCCWWDGTHEGYIASFDLAAQVKDREFRIAEDPFDLVATTSGHLVVPSGSGQWTYIRVFDAVTGLQTGAASGIRHRSRLTLHPTERIVYAADTDSYPSDIERYDLTATGAVTARWDSPYHGDHRMDGNVWASPAGDILVTRGGDVFTVGSARANDMVFIQGLSAGSITDLAWDPGQRVLFTAEGTTLHYYNLQSRLEIGAAPLSGMADFVGLSGGSVYVAMVESSSTSIIGLSHPVPGGATNTAPMAGFSVSPQTGRTTRTDLVFDASASSDAQDPLTDLRFRWDFNNDGVWDTAFLDNPAYLKRFNTAGTKIVRLQVRDSLALVAELQQSIEVTFEPDPGSPGPAHPPFELPFAATDVVFDPVRPYLYASNLAARRVYFVNLSTGLIEKEFSFALMPESLALTPDGSRLFVALRSDPYSVIDGYLASFDLTAQLKDREFRITAAASDLLVTSSGLVVTASYTYGGFGDVRVYDGVSGQETGSAFGIYRSRLSLHPSERVVYAANNGVSPDDIERYDLTATGTIARRWNSPYHGDHRMGGNVWASPVGDILVTRGGDVFTAGSTQATDMIFIQGLSAGFISDLAWDPGHDVIFTAEGSTLRYYNLRSRLEIGSTPLPGMADFMGASGDGVFAALVESTYTRVVGLSHPVPGGATNTAPTASFAVSPQTGRTTRTDLVFDASTSADAQDPLTDLRFRWDFDSDGVWDTAFLSDPVMAKRFNTAGTKMVRLQVRDSLALVSEIQQSFDVAFEPDPGTTGPPHPPFELPFKVTDVVFDPVRPYLYASNLAARKVYFVNLSTGFIEKEFFFTLMPESLALTPDGSRLFVALLTRSHNCCWWDGDHEGYIASFDLAAQVKDREFRIAEDPFDLLATTSGHIVVGSGSGQWTYIRVFDAVTGQETGAAFQLFYQSRLALHPSERIVYAANNGLSPSDIERYDLTATGQITRRWDSPYHGQHRMSGNVWASPAGDVLVTRGGDVFTVGSAQPVDMVFIRGLSAGLITDLAWDMPASQIITLEGTSLRRYNRTTYALERTQAVGSTASFLGRSGEVIYTASIQGNATTVVAFSDAPVAVAGADRAVECQQSEQALVQLDGSASTDGNSTAGTNDDIVAFDWFERLQDGSLQPVASGEQVEVSLPLGSHALVLRVTDRTGRIDEDETHLVVQDTVAPVLELSPEPALLWPPNHRLVEVTARPYMWDACSIPAITLESVGGSEVDDAAGPGDGNTTGDIQGADLGLADLALWLRAERDGGGPGRVYTMTYSASDRAGNRSEVTRDVLVPHDMGGEVDPLDIAIVETPRGTVLYWPSVQGADSYSLIRGSVSAIVELENAILLEQVTCLAAGIVQSDAPEYQDSLNPAPGEAFYYLVEYDAGSPSGFGAPDASKPREVAGTGCRW